MSWIDRANRCANQAGTLIAQVVAGYRRDGCSLQAAALTYSTLFAVVPLLTLMYAALSLVPAFQGLGDQFEQLLFDNLIPQSGGEVRRYLREFSTQARNLSAVGGVMLIVTSYLMLTTIEQTFNHIWGVTGGRRGLAGFLMYWGVLSFGPLLVGAGLLMHAYLASLHFIRGVPVDDLVTALLRYLPWLMTWIAFTLIFIAMPNCKVSTHYALAGGLVTALCFELAKASFGLLMANSSYDTLYGAFAAVPLFLLWIYLSWALVLGGAELVRALETRDRPGHVQPYSDAVAVVVACAECLQRQHQGAATSDLDILRAGIGDAQWARLRNRLLAAKILVRTAADGYVLAPDPQRLTLWQLVELAPAGVLVGALPGGNNDQPPWLRRVAALIDATRADASARFAFSLGDLLNHTEEAETTT